MQSLSPNDKQFLHWLGQLRATALRYGVTSLRSTSVHINQNKVLIVRCKSPRMAHAALITANQHLSSELVRGYAVFCESKLYDGGFFIRGVSR